MGINMGNALVLSIDTEFNNPEAPYLSIYDPIESRTGSLYLWDASSASFTPPSGVNTTIAVKNVLEAYAAGLGFGFKSSSSASVLKSEVTPKGGIHLIGTQTDGYTDANMWQGFTTNVALKAKLYALLSASSPNIYFSIWTRSTRISGGKTTGVYGPVVKYINGTTANILLLLHSQYAAINGSSLNTTTSKLGVNFRNPAILAPNYYQVNMKGYNGTLGNTDLLIGNGRLSPYNQAQILNDVPSLIIYRIYIEDLNASGRTFAEVKAIDDAEFEKAFAVGGRFYGDTWSDPATILP